nr:hypothetical protein [Tanacetum cinerariifolium]
MEWIYGNLLLRIKTYLLVVPQEMRCLLMLHYPTRLHGFSRLVLGTVDIKVKATVKLGNGALNHRVDLLDMLISDQMFSRSLFLKIVDLHETFGYPTTSVTKETLPSDKFRKEKMTLESNSMNQTPVEVDNSDMKEEEDEVEDEVEFKEEEIEEEEEVEQPKGHKKYHLYGSNLMN